MKTLINTVLISSALLASQAFAGGLSDLPAHSVERNLAAGHVATEQGFASVSSPLSNLGVSVAYLFCSFGFTGICRWVKRCACSVS
ncbi:hypothetical protein [Neptunomonas antarctica]|uniref:hypothetical protein n=1 Tax=Neptunomonas antarctica TaxID=619304 RepID=UPI0006C79357|nr:hypothetical protein [Neptunomonas antarctica]